jgi:uncharacterized membrane protein YozB (DUF420 family)
MNTTGTIAGIIDRFTMAPVRDAFVDLRNLRRSDRVLVWVGYTLLLLLIGTAAWIDLNQHRLLAVAYPAPGEVTRTIAWLVILACSLGFVAAWSYLLLAATRLPPLGGLVLIGLLVVQVAVVRGFALEVSLWRAAIMLPIALLLIAVAWWARRQTHEHAPAWPIIGFAILLLGLSLWFWSGDASERAAQAHVLFGLSFFAALPIWVLSGLALATLSTAFAAGVITRLRESFRASTLQRILRMALFAHPFLALILACPIYSLLMLDNIAYQVLGAVLTIDGLLAFGFMLIALVLLLVQKLDLRRSALLLAIRLIISLFLLTILVALFGEFNLADPFVGVIEQLQIAPPGFFFMFTLMLSILGFFVPFANTETAWLPRTARIPLAFGAALLVASTFLFLLHARQVGDGSELATPTLFPLFLLGAVALGLPYLGLVLIRGRDTLVGSSEVWQTAGSTASMSAAVAPLSRRALLAIIAALPLFLFLLGCCGINLISAIIEVASQ